MSYLRSFSGPLSLAVCVKPLSFVNQDFSLRLIEWLEVLRAQGYEKAIIYVHSVHENVMKVQILYVEFFHSCVNKQ